MFTQRAPILLAAFLLGSTSPLTAGDLYAGKTAPTETVTLPRPADVRGLEVHPVKLTLRGLEDAQQLLLTASLPDGRLQDLTGDVKYEAANPKIVRVTSSGRVIPVANGSTEVTATFGNKVVK